MLVRDKVETIRWRAKLCLQSSVVHTASMTPVLWICLPLLEVCRLFALQLYLSWVIADSSTFPSRFAWLQQGAGALKHVQFKPQWPHECLKMPQLSWELVPNTFQLRRLSHKLVRSHNEIFHRHLWLSSVATTTVCTPSCFCSLLTGGLAAPQSKAAA